MGDRAPAYASSVSDPSVMARARRLRFASRVLEALVWLIVSGSVAALGSVHPWAYVPLWGACLVAALFLAMRALMADSLKRALGCHLVAFHLSGRWLVLEPVPAFKNQGWSFDLRRPRLRSAPLFWPGLAFLVWVIVQLAPLLPAGGALTTSVPDTRRGLAFVASFLILHLAAAAVFEERGARRRFRRFVALLGLALAVVALLQAAVGTQRIYGFFPPLERGAIFGPFLNHNHFAGYMLMVVFTALGLLARAWRPYRRRAGGRSNLRRTMVTLSTPQGIALVHAAVPALAAVVALVVALVMAVSSFGRERLGVRFDETRADSPGRTAVWRDALGRMQGRWLTGTGFNTFGLSNRHTPSSALTGLPDLGGHREAPNDYLQTLVETGVPGLLIALWAAVAALVAVRRDPWLLAAVAAVLMHAFVDFDLQIPAIPALLVCLIAMGPEPTAA